MLGDRRIDLGGIKFEQKTSCKIILNKGNTKLLIAATYSVTSLAKIKPT